MLGVAPERVVVDQVGLNHLTWVRAVRLDGEDVLAELLDRARRRARRRGRAAAPAARRARRGAVVLPALLLRARRGARGAARGRAARGAVAEIERELLELYRDPALTEKPALLEQRGGAFYCEAATGLVASLAAATTATCTSSTSATAGTLAGLADDDVVEVPARVGRDGPVPLAQPPLAPELLGLVQHVAAYERLAVAGRARRRPRRRRARRCSRTR